MESHLTATYQMTNAFSKFIIHRSIFPSGMAIDGHFWVERNGKIIDPLFPELRMKQGVKEDNRVYHYATEDEMFYVLDYIRYASKMYQNVEEVRGNWENKIGLCFCNALAEVWRNGGELKFGGLGVKRTKTAVYWIYGHPANKAEDYISEHGTPSKNTGMTTLRKGKGCKECDDC